MRKGAETGGDGAAGVGEWDIVRITVPLEVEVWSPTGSRTEKLPAGTGGNVVEVLQGGATFLLGFEIYGPHDRVRSVGAALATVPAGHCELWIKCGGGPSDRDRPGVPDAPEKRKA